MRTKTEQLLQVNKAKLGLGPDQFERTVERGDYFAEIMTLFDAPPAVVELIAGVLLFAAIKLGDGKGRPLGGVPKYRESRLNAAVVDRIIAPFAGHNPAAV